MEKIIPSREFLATKISYISNIMVYYGYVHEWAELYWKLSKTSKNVWNQNENIIINVIMKHKNSKCKMKFKNEFWIKQAQILLKNKVYNYYKIEVCAYSLKSIKCFTKFITNLESHALDLFDKILISYLSANNACIQKLLEVYFDKNFDSKAIEFTNSLSINDKLLFIDTLDLHQFWMDKLIWKICNTISLTPQIYYGCFKQSQKQANYNWNKLMDISFNTLEITSAQLENIIAYFDTLNSNNQNISIISESWIKLSIQYGSTSLIESITDL